MKIELQHVHYMPKELKPRVLYVSEEFGAVAHLCPCGCGTKVRTPLGPTGWSLKETDAGPTLYPSVGNWQHDCQSHYWISKGEIIWSDKWTPEQIAEGYSDEEERSREYYDSLERQHRGILKRFWCWIKELFSFYWV